LAKPGLTALQRVQVGFEGMLQMTETLHNPSFLFTTKSLLSG
jgi:hypothetical protein